MIGRRRFTFGALLAVGTASSAARASVGESGPSPDALLAAEYRVSQRRGVLEVELALTNVSSGTIELQTLLGSRPGPRLEAHVVGTPDGERLPEIVKFDRRELISRMGPAPTYAAVAAGHTVRIGTYQFEIGRAPVEAVELFLTAYTDRDIVEMPRQVVPVGARAAV